MSEINKYKKKSKIDRNEFIKQRFQNIDEEEIKIFNILQEKFNQQRDVAATVLTYIRSNPKTITAMLGDMLAYDKGQTYKYLKKEHDSGWLRVAYLTLGGNWYASKNPKDWFMEKMYFSLAKQYVDEYAKKTEEKMFLDKLHKRLFRIASTFRIKKRNTKGFKTLFTSMLTEKNIKILKKHQYHLKIIKYFYDIFVKFFPIDANYANKWKTQKIKLDKLFKSMDKNITIDAVTEKDVIALYKSLG